VTDDDTWAWKVKVVTQYAWGPIYRKQLKMLGPIYQQSLITIDSLLRGSIVESTILATAWLLVIGLLSVSKTNSYGLQARASRHQGQHLGLCFVSPVKNWRRKGLTSLRRRRTVDDLHALLRHWSSYRLDPWVDIPTTNWKFRSVSRCTIDNHLQQMPCSRYFYLSCCCFVRFHSSTPQRSADNRKQQQEAKLSLG